MKLKLLLVGSGCCADGDDNGISMAAGMPGAVISSTACVEGAAGAALSVGALGGIMMCAGMVPAFPCSKVDDGMLLA